MTSNNLPINQPRPPVRPQLHNADLGMGQSIEKSSICPASDDSDLVRPLGTKSRKDRESWFTSELFLMHWSFERLLCIGPIRSARLSSALWFLAQPIEGRNWLRCVCSPVRFGHAA